jgi:hypothetical protein
MQIPLSVFMTDQRARVTGTGLSYWQQPEQGRGVVGRSPQNRYLYYIEEEERASCQDAASELWRFLSLPLEQVVEEANGGWPIHTLSVLACWFFSFDGQARRKYYVFVMEAKQV